MKKIFALVLVLALILGCTANLAAAEVDLSTLEPYEITWYTLGSTANSEDAVMEEINRVLTEKFNATLVMYKNSDADHQTKLQMLATAGEEFDITFVSTRYANYVAMEALAPLTDLLNEYGQDILAVYPQALWDSVTIGGEMYAIPTHKYSCSYLYYGIAKDLSEVVGVDYAWSENKALTRDEKWDAFRKWILDMKAAGADTNGYVTSVNNAAFEALYPAEPLTGSSSDPGVVVLGDDSFANVEKNVVFNQYATPEFEQFCLQSRELFEAGCLPMDPSTTAAWANNDPAVYTQDSMAKRLPGYCITYGHDYEEYLLNYAFTTTAKIYGSMNAISATSADPARAMMLLNEMIGNTEFANLIFYGIEGVSYDRNEEGQIVRNADEWNMTTWSLPGFCTAEPDTSLPINMNDMYAAFDETLVYADNVGFAFDENPVLTELAGIRQIVNEYYGPLSSGRAVVEEELPKFLDALNAAGVDAVLAEEQAQLDAWRTAQGK